MTLNTSIQEDLKIPGQCWQLLIGVNGYSKTHGDGLATQAASGRKFEILEPLIEVEQDQNQTQRIRVRLLEDGYPCWLDSSDLLGNIKPCDPCRPPFLTEQEIEQRRPEVLSWIENAAQQTNTYLWGGTLGPNFDCSGLVQSAFAHSGIWLPRDAYQQEKFCMPLTIEPNDTGSLLKGDLIFFGTPDRCTHVGLHCGDGRYWHSSGVKHGRNGIGCDGLDLADKHPVATHYRSELRGAGRVTRCHDGSTLP